MNNDYRKTYVEIKLNNIKENVSKIVDKYNNYKYYFGVVKADCYGHSGIETIQAIIDGGCNYLAVALLEEALEIRKKIKDIPIICLGYISTDYIDICAENNITITVNSVEYAEELIKKNISSIKVHLKVDTGMHRLGISDQSDFNYVYNLLKNKVNIEGLYTHIYNAQDENDTINQFDKFKKITSSINLKDIPIIHISASETIVLHDKMEFVNGCRLGIIIYGFTKDKALNLKSTFTLHSEIIQIHNLESGDNLGYGVYKVLRNTRVAVVQIGYADGIIRENTGRSVFINNRKYKIMGNICMDMLFIEIDEKVKLYDDVIILKDIDHIEEVATHLNTIPYEIICSISKRVPRIY